jgi:hypothetical protein
VGKVKKAVRGAMKAFRSGGWDGNNLSIWHPDHPLNRAMAFAGSSYTNREEIENDFEGYVLGAYKASGPVYACVTARQYVFSEVVFKFRNKSDGKLWGDSRLDLLENPWPGGTTGELLAKMEQDASLAGNSWWTITNDQGDYGNAAKRKGTGQRLAHLRPDWVTMVIGTKRPGGSVRDIDATLLGVKYKPGGRRGIVEADDEVFLTMEEVVHYSPNPDPIARFRGMSWITPVLRDIEADKSAVKHKGAFFDNAAVPNMAVTFDKETNEDDFNEFVSNFNGSHQGAWQAYKTLFLMGGADVTPLSHDFKSMDFSAVIGKGESRIASVAGVPPSWVGFSEGMQGSALNTGNMAANRRRFADGTIRPLWRMAAASLAVLVDVPSDSELWFDESGVAFLREDQRDRAEIMRIDMSAINTGILAGYEPDAVTDAVFTNDLRKLIGKHTGLVSVQMQPPVDNDNELEEANIFGIHAKTLQALTSAGFTEESAVEAIRTNDLGKLKKAPVEDQWTPSGIPIPPAQPGTPAGGGGGAKPPAPNSGAKPPASGTQPPKGASNG